MKIRTLSQYATTLINRARFSNISGYTFGGRRDQYQVLGYQRQLFPQDYRSRFQRNEIANRIVKARPNGTWRGGAAIVEDDDPTKENNTDFEQAFIDLDNRVKLWDNLRKVDILSGIGRYGVLLIGAPGEMDQPIERLTLDDIAYLMPYAEEDATIQRFDIDPNSPRFGQPEFYTIKRTSVTNATSTNSISIAKRVHWTRAIHVSDGLLDDNVYGEPRQQCVWNRLDDLEKIVGGGAEAFWRRADQGKQFDLDPTIDLTPEQVAEMQTEVDKYIHDGKRMLRTRGMKINNLGSDVADFSSQVTSVMSLISAGSNIPQRVLMGSEQGKLAAKQDRISWDNQISDRQNDYAGPCMVRPFVDRMALLGAVAIPADGYDVRFSSITTMDDEQRAEMGTRWSKMNAVTRNELRTRVLQLPELEGPQGNEILGSTSAPFGGAPQPLSAKDEATVTILEAAITHNKTCVLESLLGMQSGDATDPSATALLQETRELIRALTPEAFARVMAAQPAPTIHVDAPTVNIEPAVIHVAAPQVHIEPPAVHVNVEAPPPAQINVEAPPPANVHVQVEAQPRLNKRVERDAVTNLITRVVEEA